MRKKLVAFVLALFCCSPVLDCTAFAQEEPVVPDWIPQNFEQAMEFDDTYGKTHIADGVICCVQKRTTATDDYQYETVLSGSVDSESVRILSEASYYFAMPDFSDSENSEDYLAYPEYFGTPYFYYQVTVYQPLSDGTFSVSWLENREGFEKPVRQTDLSFQVENGIIEETDCYGWLPDCIREFSTFRQENGTVSVHNNYNNNYIVYCDDVCYDGGYDVTFAQSGTTELREIRRYNIAVSREFALDGGTGHTVIVYAPVSAGSVKATWLQERPWETWGNAEEVGTVCFEIQEDLSVQEIKENQFAEPVQNDITGDGVFDILDVITLQKWLSGKAQLANWRNADLNTDGIVNIYDLCLLKKALLKSRQNITYSVLEQSWVHGSSRVQDMKEQIHLAKSVSELQEIIQNYELCETCDCFYQTVDNLIPEELNDAFFEEHAVIVLYSSAGSGDRSIELNKIVWEQQNLTVYTTTRSLYPPTPDMAYCRTILMIDKNDIANWTEDSEIVQKNRSVYKNIF
ncbi:MAG: dockerin type I repeat-containing protein [Oscillospiraceae bacterium]|nr:dockerin type I repeat-containing protein [Oscillospiraceae bacterium]